MEQKKERLPKMSASLRFMTLKPNHDPDPKTNPDPDPKTSPNFKISPNPKS